MYSIRNKCIRYEANVLITKRMCSIRNKCIRYETNVFDRNKCIRYKTNVFDTKRIRLQFDEVFRIRIKREMVNYYTTSNA